MLLIYQRQLFKYVTFAFGAQRLESVGGVLKKCESWVILSLCAG